MLWYAGWGGNTDLVSLFDKLVRKARSVVGLDLESLDTVAERRMKYKLKAILDNPFTSP